MRPRAGNNARVVPTVQNADVTETTKNMPTTEHDESPGPDLEYDPEIHHAHRDVTGGWIRPAVFGVMDGLVSNFALIAGVIGAGASQKTVVITGLAGLAAGAFSMATGEYVSVTSQAELTHAEIAKERRELDAHPHEEEKELAKLFEARGVSKPLAVEVARELSTDPDVRWRVHVREEMGVDPDDLPSPWLAAGSSFVAFALGALIPVLPYVLGASGIAAALVVSLVGLFGTGAAIAYLTVQSWWFGGLRQVLLGALAAGVTFLVGGLVGGGLT